MPWVRRSARSILFLPVLVSGSGAKVVLVLGDTACGAVKGAIDDVVLGNLTGLLARI